MHNHVPREAPFEQSYNPYFLLQLCLSHPAAGLSRTEESRTHRDLNFSIVSLLGPDSFSLRVFFCAHVLCTCSSACMFFCAHVLCLFLCVHVLLCVCSSVHVFVHFFSSCVFCACVLLCVCVLGESSSAYMTLSSTCDLCFECCQSLCSTVLV